MFNFLKRPNRQPVVVSPVAVVDAPLPPVILDSYHSHDRVLINLSSN